MDAHQKNISNVISKPMKCSKCKYYMNSKMFGSGCNCPGVKPCDIERKRKKNKYHKRDNKKRREKYADTTRE